MAEFRKNKKSGDALETLFWKQGNEQELSLAFRLMAHMSVQC